MVVASSPCQWRLSLSPYKQVVKDCRLHQVLSISSWSASPHRSPTLSSFHTSCVSSRPSRVIRTAALHPVGWQPRRHNIIAATDCTFFSSRQLVRRRARVPTLIDRDAGLAPVHICIGSVEQKPRSPSNTAVRQRPWPCHDRMQLTSSFLLK